ncbi:hypothetical protein BDV26DRAFT_176853 [Aspergillus bertholletiae]|uniref:Uncharacterized protein n=1 Tax=Aspergillus bertholletiae TaxID=1226010 RepID=A0A5N7BB21_9EURO|nr:hypothetical protein BDV26DRAFT_176853 [Aspergillus bertholletiae]
MARSKATSKASSRRGNRNATQMSWNNNNVNILWQIILRTQSVNLDANLAEIAAAWPSYPRPTVFALEQQLANFRRHSRAGNSVVLRRGNLDDAIRAQAAANARAAANTHVAAITHAAANTNVGANNHTAGAVNAHTHVPIANGGTNGHTASNATAQAHAGFIHAAQAMAGPSNNSHAHAMNGGNTGWSSPPPLQIHRAKESQVPVASPGPRLVWALVPAPSPPTRALELSSAVRSRVATRIYWPYPLMTRHPVSNCYCRDLTCFTCYEKIRAGR